MELDVDEEDALARWLKKSRTSPLSREAMGTDYTQNLALRQLIQAWRAASPSRSVCVCGVGGGWEGCTLCCQVNIAFETPSLHQTTAYLKQSLSRLPDCLSAARLQEHGLDVDDQDITVLPTAAGPLAARSGVCGGLRLIQQQGCVLACTMLPGTCQYHGQELQYRPLHGNVWQLLDRATSQVG